MRGKPFLFISIVCILALAACAPPAVIPPTGSGSGSLQPSATPAPANTTSGPEVSTTMPGGPVVSGGTGEPGTAVPLPGQGGGGSTGGIVTPGPDGNLSITLDDRGKTVQLKVGEEFLLNLGEGYDWSPEVADQGVISRVPNIAVIRGAQGIYKAHKAGTTTLNAAGNPTCLQSTPPCAMPSILFTITIEVR